MKMPQSRKLFASAAVAASILLGTVDKAQAQSLPQVLPANTNVINFVVNGTCEDPAFDAGIYYTAGTTKVAQYYSIDTTLAGQGYTAGVGYEVITTPTNTVITPLQPVGVGLTTYIGGNALMFVGGAASPYSMGSRASKPSLMMSLPVSSSTLLPLPLIFSRYFNYITTNRNPATAYATAYTSDNSPNFQIDSITMPIPITVSLAYDGTNIDLSWNTMPGLTYQPQYSPTWCRPAWAVISQSLQAVGAIWEAQCLPPTSQPLPPMLWSAPSGSTGSCKLNSQLTGSHLDRATNSL